MAEHKSPPKPREIIQELDHTATFYPLGFEEEVAPSAVDVGLDGGDEELDGTALTEPEGGGRPPEGA